MIMTNTDRRIIRVFPRRTSHTPTDDMAFIGDPPLIRPAADGVHVSCTFTWDIEESQRLARAWNSFYPTVRIGGPAFGLDGFQFNPGRYVKPGIVHTSRGCNFRCPWCLVPDREGEFQELSHIAEGNIIQDNNILLSRKPHLRRVFDMLKGQKTVKFTGGLDVRLLRDWHVEQLRGLRIRELWLAFDSMDRQGQFQKAVLKLKRAGFYRNQIRCYVLAGFNEPIQEAEIRLRFAYDCGAMPFVQVYRDVERRILTQEDRKWVWKWSRPAVIKAMCRDG